MFDVDQDRGWDKVVKHLINWNTGVIFWGAFANAVKYLKDWNKLSRLVAE